MNYAETEQWLYSQLFQNGNLTFQSFGKGKKVFQITHFNSNKKKQALLPWLNKLEKLFRKANTLPLHWAKINIHDNAYNTVAALGYFEEQAALGLLLELLSQDTAIEAGTTIILLFEAERDVLLSIVNDQSEERFYLKVYGDNRFAQKIINTFLG